MLRYAQNSAHAEVLDLRQTHSIKRMCLSQIIVAKWNLFTNGNFIFQVFLRATRKHINKERVESNDRLC